MAQNAVAAARRQPAPRERSCRRATKVVGPELLELTSNLTTLAYDCTPDPTSSWQSYVVPLSEAGWKMTTITGAAVTAAQFKSVLANLTRVRIRGEFTNAVDTGYLDNVYLGSKAK
jgi:hypothetical protein